MYGIGMQELLVILLIVVLIFGAKKLPEIGGGLGKAIRNFKRASSSPTKSTSPPKMKRKRTIRPIPRSRSGFSFRRLNPYWRFPPISGKISSAPQMEAGSNARHIRKATMKVEQLSIFLGKQSRSVGRSNRETLAQAGINIRALSGRYVRFRHSPSDRERYGKSHQYHEGSRIHRWAYRCCRRGSER